MSAGISIPLESKVKYLRRRVAELEGLAAMNESAELFELGKKVGHQIKGNAATFEFPDLAELGRNLESVSQGQDAAAVHSAVQALMQIVSVRLQQLS